MQQVRNDNNSDINFGNGSDGKAITWAAGRMALGTLSSRILGLFRDMILTALFAPAITDTFVVTFRLINVIRRVLAEGSVTSAFVPIYVGHKANAARAARFVLAAGLGLLSVASVVTVLGLVFMPAIMRLVMTTVPPSDSTEFQLAVWLGRLVFGYFFLVSTYAFWCALAQAHGRFFWPAAAPAVFNIFVIASMFLPSLKFTGDQMIWGILSGGLALNGFVIIAIWPEIKQLAKATLAEGGIGLVIASTAGDEIKLFFRNLILAVAGLSSVQGISLLNIYFAGKLSSGALSSIYLADRLLELPLSLVAVSLGSALLPMLSAHWDEKRHADFMASIMAQAEVLLFLLLPCALGLWFLDEPIVRVLFQHGLFREEEVAMTTLVLRINSIILILMGLSRLILIGLHSTRRLWVGAAVSSLAMIFHFLVARYLLATELQITSLMRATLLTAIFSTGLLSIFFFYRWYRVLRRASLVESAKVVVDFIRRMAPAFGALLTILAMANELMSRSNVRVGWVLTVELAGAISLAAVVYLIVGRYCRVGLFRASGGR